MSQSDRAAAEAVLRHHEQLDAALTALVAELIDAAETGSLRRTGEGRDALLGWVHAELLPHAYAEEESLYPVAAQQPGARLLVDGMFAEHRAIAELVTELETTPSPVAAAAAGRALRAVFETHLAKENDLIVPLLVEADGVDLAGLLAGMHELLGGSDEPAAGGCGCGGCGCGGDAPGADSAAVATLTIDPRIDVRDLPHAQRHARVFAALESVPDDGALVLIAPHAPRPLLAEIDRRHAGQFATEWLQEGPDVWQVRLRRVASRTPLPDAEVHA